MIDWSQIRHFTPDEFSGEMDSGLIYMLDAAREIAGIKFTLASTRRQGSGTSAHNTGHAVDIRCSDSVSRFVIVAALFAVGFRRIGIYDKHIHADNSETHDQDVCWIGKSK